MTPEQPTPPPRQPRPGVDARRRALGLGEGERDGDGPAATDGPPATPPQRSASRPTPSSVPGAASREPLAASLARIPDLGDEGPDAFLPPNGDGDPAAVAPKAAAPRAPSTTSAGPAAAPPDASPTPAGGTDDGAGAVAVLEAPAGDARRAARTEAVPRQVPTSATVGAPPADAPPGDAGPTAPAPLGPRPWWRRALFAIVLVGLVAAIPVLGVYGAKLVSESTAGNVNDTNRSPEDPGFEAQVDPTPTAVAIQYDDTGMPSGVTFLAESGGDGGGTVIFVPLDTQVTEPSFGVNKLRTAYEVSADRPTIARDRLSSQVARLLTVGASETIDLTNETWAQLVAPVAPLQIDNPDAVTLPDGTTIASGEVELTAEQVGPYLSATIEGESDLNRMVRQQAVWEAWLTAVGESGRDDIVPGESDAGIARFAQALAKGPVRYETLPVEPSPDGANLFISDQDAIRELITESVPSPTGAVPGSRFNVRLLNGVSPGAIPSDFVREVVSRGGAVTVLGNGPKFGQEVTEIVYGNKEDEDIATLMATSLGIEGEARFDPEAPDTVDLTILLGEDLLGDDASEGAPGATTPESPGGS